jgi:uncharacterized membrane protein YkvA (DUF1232 family)
MRKYLSKKFWSDTNDLEDEKIEEAVADVTDKLSVAEKEAIIQNNFLPKVQKFASKLPFVRDLLAGYYCMLDDKTPKPIKAAILLPLVYFVVPVDAVPDIIPMAGYSDDIAVWLGAVKLFGDYIKASHYGSADAILQRDSIPDKEITKLLPPNEN